MNTAIEQHYSRDQLFEKIVAALKTAGIDKSKCTRKDIAGVDEFHVRGEEVSKELAKAAGLKPGMRILDVGCGIGGPCRLFADEYGCIATGIDITAEYIRTASSLSALTGLQDKTRFVQGSALELPFENESFDIAWTQHVQMNIEDKQTFYKEIYRVLVPGGRFIYYDIFSRDHHTIQFPVPWATDPELSFLITPQELTALLAKTGFQQVNITDQTAKGISFFKKLFERIEKQGPPPIGLHLLIGEETPLRLKNVYRNLSDGKIVLESGVCIKK